MSVDLGATYRATLAVKDANGNPANCTTMALNITTPDQAVTPVSPVNPPAIQGIYLWDFPTAQAGLHAFSWQGSGGPGGGVAQVDYVNVRTFRALFPLAEARDYLAVQDTSRDQAIRGCMAAATRLTERIVGTCVIRQFAGEFIASKWTDIIALEHGPLPSTSSVASLASVYAGGPSWVTTGPLQQIIVNPEAATLRLTSFLPFWFGPWLCTYTAGRTEISEDIINGCKEIMWDLWANQRGTLTDQQDPTLAEVSAFETIPAGYRIPPRALELLEAERRPGFG